MFFMVRYSSGVETYTGLGKEEINFVSTFKYAQLLSKTKLYSYITVILKMFC